LISDRLKVRDNICMIRYQQVFQLFRYCTFLYLIRNHLYLKYLEELLEVQESTLAYLHSTSDNELLYQGRRYDSKSNLYYYRARYHDPILGRFLSTDPMGYKDSMNLYQAFNMNGLNFVDPMGELFVKLNLTNKPVKFVNDIPDNPLGKGGVTRPVVEKLTVFWKYLKDKTGRSYWQPDMHLNLRINIFYLERSGYIKAHEWRHVEDILFAFPSIIDDLKNYESETRIYSDEINELGILKKHENEMINMFRLKIERAIEHSRFVRDEFFSPYVLWYEALDWLVDSILDRDSGKPYKSEYIWSDK